jgi:Fur family transcriptional regulator, peroxide stress response regulator
MLPLAVPRKTTVERGLRPEIGDIDLTRIPGWYNFASSMTSQDDGSQGPLVRFERLCREQGLPVTVQRRAVLEAVVGRDDHPTADQVFEEVQGRIPGVSRTTVYRVLDMLVRFGIITKACHQGAMARFDGNTDRHHHLVCLRCERVIDLEDERLDALPLPDTGHLGFEITDFHVQLHGICKACREKAVDSNPASDSDKSGVASSLDSNERRSLVQEKKDEES